MKWRFVERKVKTLLLDGSRNAARLFESATSRSPTNGLYTRERDFSSVQEWFANWHTCDAILERNHGRWYLSGDFELARAPAARLLRVCCARVRFVSRSGNSGNEWEHSVLTYLHGLRVFWRRIQRTRAYASRGASGVYIFRRCFHLNLPTELDLVARHSICWPSLIGSWTGSSPSSGRKRWNSLLSVCSIVERLPLWMS